MLSLYIIIFVLALFILVRSSDFLIRSLTGLAKLFKFSEYVVAFIFMSMATSIPELFVGLSSAIKNIPEFSLGTVLGSNLVNVTLIIGLTVFFGKGLRIDSKISRRNFWVISVLSFFPLFLASDGVISRGDGLILLLLFIFYISQISREKEYFSKTVNNLPHKETHLVANVKHLTYFFIGVVLLIFSSLLIVWSGQAIAEMTTISVLSFGIIFVALGTSLPEIAFGIRARLLKHDSMVIGNSLGSNAFNATLIVGLVSLVRPIYVTVSLNLIVVALFTFLALLFFNFFVFSKSFVSRKEGFVLVLIYLAFLTFEYFEYFV
ncbi:sodium:calcium antiporter [Patescibacteria group bacterium]